MERRALGKTGERLSVVGFGGIVVMNETPEDAARFVAENGAVLLMARWDTNSIACYRGNILSAKEATAAFKPGP